MMAAKQLVLPTCGKRRRWDDRHPRQHLFRTMSLLAQIEDRALAALEEYDYQAGTDEEYDALCAENDRCVDQALNFYAVVIGPVYRAWWTAWRTQPGTRQERTSPMALTTNKARRDAILRERVAAIGGTLLEVDSSKYGSDPTCYYLYVTFPDDEGPAVHYRHGRELAEPYHAYRVIIKGGIDALDRVTTNPAHLAIHAYRERRDHHYEARKIEDLQRQLDRARKDHGRVATETMVNTIRNDGVTTEGDARALCQATISLREAVNAYDAAHSAMIAVVGEYPKSDDNYYPRY